MINFRYHVVSLTAVFLALAIGLVVGTAALNGPVADSLKNQVDALGKQNQEYRDRLDHLEQDVAHKEGFADAVAPAVLADRLADRRVLLVSLPSAGDYVDGVVSDLKLAGATITGQVEIKDKFIDPARNAELLDLAHLSLKPSITGTLPANTDGVESSAALLAAVLLDRTPPVSPADLHSVLTAYQGQGYLAINGGVTKPAEAVVMIAGAPVTDSQAKNKNAAVVTMIDQFSQAGNVIVAGSGLAGDGNALAAVRADPHLSTTISTVDNASTPQGRMITALAVADQLNGTVGAYGVGNGATLLPKLDG